MIGRNVHFAVLLAALSLGVAGCGDGQKAEPVLAEAFAGPITLNLREEIRPQSKTIASARHGEKLQIVQVRRRFVRVRTPSGGTGWTEMRQLLTQAQMDSLSELAKEAAKLPSQGEATVYSPLNVHTEPTRPSPSFLQITEGIKVHVVGHKLMPRTAQSSAPSIVIAKPAPPRRARKPRKEPAVPPPPRPGAPALPPGWRELSRSALPPELEEPPAPPALPTPPVPMEDWSLVRTADGKAGWALTRNLVMAIPDEVAQYSEGARIAGYFALADVQDGDETKHHWLWTTIRDNAKPYQYDSFRIFTWVVRKHRYETAYIERGVEGYYPTTATPGKIPKFSLVIRGEDGNLYRKHYIMEGYLVRKVGEEPYTPSRLDPEITTPLTGDPAEGEESEMKESVVDRLKSWFRRS